MPVSKENERLMVVLSKEQKEKLRLVAQRHHRSMSQETAYALELYLGDFDDEGGRKRREEKRGS